MDDIIFLIIAVALSIFAAIKKNKKKDTDDLPLTEDEKSSRNFFMDQLLGEDFLADSEEIEEKPKHVRPVVVREAQVFRPQARTSELVRTGFGRNLPDHSKRTMQPTVKASAKEFDGFNVEVEEVSSYKSEFSLRKAFVYSEIMNPKYIDQYN